MPAPLKFFAIDICFCSVYSLGTRDLSYLMASYFFVISDRMLDFLNYNYFIAYFFYLCFS